MNFNEFINKHRFLLSKLVKGIEKIVIRIQKTYVNLKVCILNMHSRSYVLRVFIPENFFFLKFQVRQNTKNFFS